MSQETILKWTRGLVGAAINSAAAAGAALVVDFGNFNPANGGLKRLGVVMGVAAIAGSLLYLKQHPIPEE